MRISIQNYLRAWIISIDSQLKGQSGQRHRAVYTSAEFIRMSVYTTQYDRILKLSRTIMDLARSDEIYSVHPAETLQYRLKIMMGSQAIEMTNVAPGIPSSSIYVHVIVNCIKIGRREMGKAGLLWSQRRRQPESP